MPLPTYLPACLCAADMPELMGPALFQNMDPEQLAQLQKMAAQVCVCWAATQTWLGKQ